MLHDQGEGAVLRATATTVAMFLLVAPQLVAGLLVGALVQQLIDRDTVVRLMGSGRRLKHLLAAEGAGALTPGGAFAFFPTIHALRSAGADIAILITYLTAWTLFGFTRVLVFELPLLGVDLTLFRLVTSLPLPRSQVFSQVIFCRDAPSQGSRITNEGVPGRIRVGAGVGARLGGLPKILARRPSQRGSGCLLAGHAGLRPGPASHADRFFVAEILPPQMISRVLGSGTGVTGIVLGTLIGAVMPGGPLVSFPVVLLSLSGGAGVPQTMAFLTSWSIIAFQQLFAYELPLMGWRFAALRLVASAALPIISGILALLLMRIWPSVPSLP